MKPMLAGTVRNLNTIKYPLIASPKLDGIRIVIDPELGPVTRSLKPVPNLHIRRILQQPEFDYFDGEIVVGNLGATDAFNITQSAVMSTTGTPDFKLIVFDSFERPTDGYTTRFADVAKRILMMPHHTFLMAIPNVEIHNYGELQDFETEALDAGYEGVMIRQPNGPYKFGRSTEREGTLVKMKQFTDAEAEVIGFEYLQHNMNEATRNALGRTERSSHAAGKVEDHWQLGALVCRGLNNGFEGVEFKIGTGFTAAVRAELAMEGDDLVGRIVNYVYQDEGSKDAPRFPRFHGFRDPDTMS